MKFTLKFFFTCYFLVLVYKLLYIKLNRAYFECILKLDITLTCIKHKLILNLRYEIFRLKFILEKLY